MENPFEEQQNQFQRPTFLLVLCILTFIGSGWGTLSNLFSVFTAGLTDSSMQMEHSILTHLAISMILMELQV